MFEEKVKKLFFFVISVLLIFFVLCHLILIGICFDINRKYIQTSLNKINIDFENNKINNIWTLILIFFVIFYLVFYICIILYLFIIGNNNLYKLENSIKIFDNIKNLFCPEKKEEQPSVHPSHISAGEISEISDSYNKCIICVNEENLIAFAPCGHRCCCEKCYKNNERYNAMQNCPICRVKILHYIK